MSRTITDLTITRARQLASDSSTPALRKFHHERYMELQARAKIQQTPTRETPFSRFEKSLNTKDHPPQVG